MQMFADNLCKQAKYLGMEMSAPQKIFQLRGQPDLDDKLMLCEKNGIEVSSIT